MQAPQLPLLQPSLAPVSRKVSRSTSSRLCRGSQRKSTGSLIHRRGDVDLLGHGTVPRTVHGP